MLHIQGLRLPTGQTIDLDLKAGEIHCLRGASGVGKTRLLRALADLDPNDGLLQLNGQNRCDMSGPQWREQVMLVPARPRWWHRSTKEHMARPMQDIAEKIGLNEKQLGNPPERLSSGESSRLALLRALSREPAVLLLDEPTAALDEDSETAVETLLKDYIAGGPARCILWITHSKSQAQRVAHACWRLTEQGLENTA